MPESLVPIGEENPYYQDDRRTAHSFLIVQPQAYENEFVEEFVVLQNKERFLLKIVFVGGCMLLFALL